MWLDSLCQFCLIVLKILLAIFVKLFSPLLNKIMFLFVGYLIDMNRKAPLVGIGTLDVKINKTFFCCFSFPIQTFFYFLYPILVSLIQNVLWFEKLIYFFSFPPLIRVKALLKVFKFIFFVLESVENIGIVSFWLFGYRTFRKVQLLLFCFWKAERVQLILLIICRSWMNRNSANILLDFFPLLRWPVISLVFFCVLDESYVLSITWIDLKVWLWFE
jgi:hypothetical protein